MEFIQWTKGKEKLCLPISYLCDPISYVKDKDAAGLSTSKLKFKWRHPLITPGIANFGQEVLLIGPEADLLWFSIQKASLTGLKS